MHNFFKLPWSGRQRQRGIVAIPLVVGIVALIAVIALSVSSISFSEIDSSSKLTETERALLHAESGARDALTRIVRNRNYENTGGYDIDFANDDATCDVPADGCATIEVYSTIGGTVLSPHIIVSEGTYKDSVRKLNVVAITAGDDSGHISSLSWHEVKNAPIPIPAQATNVGTDSATLNGWVNTNGISVTAWFRWIDVADAPDNCDNTFTNGTNTATSSITGSSTPDSFSENIPSGLSSNTTYIYCVIAEEDSSGDKHFSRFHAFTTN